MFHRLVYLNMEFSVLFQGCFGTFTRWVQPAGNESSHRGEVMVAHICILSLSFCFSVWGEMSKQSHISIAVCLHHDGLYLFKPWIKMHPYNTSYQVFVHSTMKRDCCRYAKGLGTLEPMGQCLYLVTYEVLNPSYGKSELTLGRKDQNCILSNLPFNLEGYWVLPQ